MKNGRGRALLFLAIFHFPSPFSSFLSSPFEIYPSVSALSEFPLLENETAFLLLIHGAAPVFVLRSTYLRTVYGCNRLRS